MAGADAPTLAVASPRALLVIGIVSTEKRKEWRDRLRTVYKPWVDRGVVILKFVLDSRRLPDNALDELGVPISKTRYRYFQTACAHKMVAFWQQAGRWPAQYYVKTDDDAALNLHHIVPLVQSLPRKRLYSGILRYSSMNDTTLEGVCWAAGPNGALNKKRTARECKGPTVSGPYPFAEGPFILISSDVQQWVSTRLRRDARQQCHFEDLLLGRALSQHPRLRIVNLGALLSDPNIVSNRGVWLGTNGPLAHWTRTAALLSRTVKSFELAVNASPPRVFPRPPCAPWRDSYPRLHQFSCCTNWTLCDGKETNKYWKGLRAVYQASGRAASIGTESNTLT